MRGQTKAELLKNKVFNFSYIDKIYMQNYTEQILVRLKKGQNEILKQEASKYHLPVSSYVRLLLFKEEKKELI